MEKTRGKVWKFGDNINTTIITPDEMFHGQHVEMKDIVFAGLRPTWKDVVKPGDIIVAGRNWGGGSHREGATTVLKELGVAAIVADSIAKIYYRNCISIALPAIMCPGVSEFFNEGDEMELDIKTAEIKNLTTNKTIKGMPLPEIMMQIFEAGGIIQILINELNKGQ